MSTALLSLPRLWRRTPAAAAPSTRLQVCPPEAWPAPAGLGTQIMRWIDTGRAMRAVTRRQADLLADARDEFNATIDDLLTHAADEMRLRIGRARSLRELWHLRSALFMVLGRALGEAEAERRMSALNRFFPTRAPRSAFAPLTEQV